MRGDEGENSARADFVERLHKEVVVNGHRLVAGIAGRVIAERHVEMARSK